MDTNDRANPYQSPSASPEQTARHGMVSFLRRNRTGVVILALHACLLITILVTQRLCLQKFEAMGVELPTLTQWALGPWFPVTHGILVVVLIGAYVGFRRWDLHRWNALALIALATLAGLYVVAILLPFNDIFMELSAVGGFANLTKCAVA